MAAEDASTIFLTPAAEASSSTFSKPLTLMSMHSPILLMDSGTETSAAIWKI